MKKIKLVYIGMVICLLTGCAGFAPASKPLSVYWPSTEWRSSTPEETGMDSEMLARMFQQVEEQGLNLHSLLIVRNGTLVTEAYFQPYTKDQPQFLASVTKSVIGTLVGIAIQKGNIKDINQTVVSFFPDKTIANLDELKKSMTIKDLLSLTAGLKCNDAPLSGQVGMEGSDDWVQFMLDAPMTEQPGTKFNYCGGAVHLLSAIIQKATGMSARDFANQSLFGPLGIPDVPETSWLKDPQGISMGPYGLYLTPRDMAKLGYLYLRNGKWEQQQILPADWVKSASTAHTTKDNGLGYGYLWTVDPDQGSFSALGFAGQQIYVIPAKDLIVVFTGSLPSYKPDMDFLPLKALVDNYILPAVKSDRALPENTVATAKLNDSIQKSSFPQQAVRPVPEGALKWSGIVYQLDDNPVQWKTISFDIKPNADILSISINGQVIDPPVGLDNAFRIQESGNGVAPQAIRGYWEDENTLVIQLITIGELADQEARIVFSADEIDLPVKNVITGQESTLHGRRVE